MNLSFDVVSILLITATPLTIIMYNILSKSGYLTPEDASQLDQSWKEGLRQGEIHPDNTSFNTIISIISNRTDQEISNEIKCLKLTESAFGGAGVIAVFKDERDNQVLAPLTLTEKWINEYVEGRNNDIEIGFYILAIIFLISGLILELLIRLNII